MKTDRLKIIFLLCSLWLVFPCFCLAAKGKDFVVVIDPGHGGHDPVLSADVEKKKTSI